MGSFNPRVINQPIPDSVDIGNYSDASEPLYVNSGNKPVRLFSIKVFNPTTVQAYIWVFNQLNDGSNPDPTPDKKFCVIPVAANGFASVDFPGGAPLQGICMFWSTSKTDYTVAPADVTGTWCVVYEKNSQGAKPIP
jgi:hypothetical protein